MYRVELDESVEEILRSLNDFIIDEIAANVGDAAVGRKMHVLQKEITSLLAALETIPLLGSNSPNMMPKIPTNNLYDFKEGNWTLEFHEGANGAWCGNALRHTKIDLNKYK